MQAKEAIGFILELDLVGHIIKMNCKISMLNVASFDCSLLPTQKDEHMLSELGQLKVTALLVPHCQMVY